MKFYIVKGKMNELRFSKIAIVIALITGTRVQAQVNYVRTYDATAPEQNAINLMSRWVSDVKTTTQYIDGLGRPIQTVLKQGSLKTETNEIADFVSTNVYDEFGREQNKYLPFVANNTGGNTNINDGAYKTNPLVQQQAFSAIQYPGENYFYSKTKFEASILNRPVDTYAPGTSWAGSEGLTPSQQRNVQLKYYLNTQLDDVKIWNVTDNPIVGNFGTYSIATNINGGIYAAGQLYKNITIDEHKKQVIEFKDKEGKVILKKVQLTAADDIGAGSNNVGWLCTYYIYDDLNNLRCVIQPEAVKQLPAASYQLSTFVLAEQCFRYEYDQSNRLVKKKVPGSGEVCMVYDDRDRLILTQDANMRVGTVKWMYTKYDDLNRPIATGLWPSALTQQQHAANTLNNLAYPILAGEEELSKTFYDNYNWLASYSTGLSASYNYTYDSYFQTASNSAWPYAQANMPATQFKGMVTGSRVKVLGTANTYLYNLPIYDEKGRVIQNQSINSTGGIDIATTQYTWAGQPLVMVSKQQTLPLAGGVGGGPQETVTVTQLSYDDLGRVLKTEKKVSNSLVSGGAMSTYKAIAQNKYDKLGQLVNKNVGNKPNTLNPLVKLDYEYNIRGWLTSINKDYVVDGNNGNNNNDKYFGMQLGYDKDGFGAFTKKEYNGNIAGSIWRSVGDGIDRKYDYDYDPDNRLLKADFTQYNGTVFALNPQINFNVKMGDGTQGSNTVPNNAYDDNGNIKQMQQWGLKINSSPLIDNLIYEYKLNSNQLAKVTDQGIVASDNGKLGDFKDGTNTGDDYAYDANGNLNIDNNKNIGNITYNHLNLPSVITIPNKGSITYTYDASGNKLKKVTYENPATIPYNNITYNTDITTTTNYIGGLVYESKSYGNTMLYPLNYNDVLQFIPQEEGRIRFKPADGNSAASFVYDYMVKDHLGNVRVVLTEEQKQDVYPAATLEDASYNNGNALSQEQKFYDINPTKIVLRADATGIPNYGNFNTPLPVNNNQYSNPNSNSQKLYKLNSTSTLAADKMGLGITLKVMAGDIIDVAGKSYYFDQLASQGGNNLLQFTDVLTGFLGGVSGLGATSVHGSVSVSQINPGTSNPTVNSLLNAQTTQSQTTPNNPRAFINVIFFDEQFNAIDFKISKVGYANVLKEDHIVDLQNLVAAKSGFVYVYVSNESPVNVFFDNLQVVHTRGALLETSEFYPFGLKAEGISYRAASSMENKYKYNGKELQSKEFSDGSGLELYDYSARFYDAQIARWHKTDGKSELYFGTSPYVYALNQPTNAIDPDGNIVIFINGNAGSSGGKSDYWRKDEVTSRTWVTESVTYLGYTGSTGYWRENVNHINFDEKVMDQLNDKKAIYRDGGLGGIFNQDAYPFSMYSSDRREAGREQGQKDAKSIIDKLERDKNGNITETIKIITHSMGGVYGSGYLAALKSYIKSLPIEQQRQILITLVVDFDPFQAGSITADMDIKTQQYKHKNKWNIGGLGFLANEDENGLDKKDIITNSGTSTDHSIFTFINDINNLSEGKYKWDEINKKFVKL